MPHSPEERVARIRKTAQGVEAQYGIGSWEKEFLASVSERFSLTPKQEAKLQEIENRVLGQEEDPPDPDDDLGAWDPHF